MTMYARIARLVCLVAVSLSMTFTACTSAAHPPREVAAVEFPGITLLVRNDNWLQVDVYLLRATTRQRLGTVSSMGTQIFRIPRALYATSGTVQLLADPIGTDETFRTEQIPVGQARQIELTVADYL